MRTLPAETLIETRRPWAAPVVRATIEVPGGPVLKLSDRYVPAFSGVVLVSPAVAAALGPILFLDTFDSSITGWSIATSGTGAVAWSSVDGGVMRFTGGSPSAIASARKDIPVLSGVTYVVSVQSKKNSAGALTLVIGSTGGGVDLLTAPITTTGTYSFTITAISSIFSITIVGTAQPFDFEVDNVTIQEAGTPARDAVYRAIQDPETLALVAAWGTVEESLNPLDAGGAPGTWDGFRLANTRRIGGFANIAALNEMYPLAGAKVTLSRLGPTLSRTGEITLGVFYVEDLTDLDDPLVTLRMSDITLGFEDSLPLPRVTRAVLPFAPRASLDKVIPVPFGPLPRIPCIPIVDGAASTLAVAIDITQTFIELDDTDVSDDFPASGTALIDFELVDYTGKTGRTLTGCTRGAHSTLAAEHAEGESVYEARDSYVFAVGVGEIDVSDIMVSGVSARTSPVASVDSNLIPGTPITIITFPVTDTNSFHVIGAGGTFTLSPAEVKVQDPATSGTRVIPPGFAFSAPNHRTVNFTIPFSGGSPGWNVKRRLAGGVFTTIASGAFTDLPFTGSHTADYISDGDDEIQLNITSGSGYDVHLQFTLYSILIDATGTSPSGGSTTAAVLGDVTCQVQGVRDDGYGTITGTAGLMLEVPADITRYVLTHLYGVPDAMLGPRWAATRAAQVGAHLVWAFLLGFDGPVLFSEFRRSVGEQSRSRLLVDAGLIDLVWQADRPAADFRLDYERQVWDQLPATASKTASTQVARRILADARRNYETDEYRYLAAAGDAASPETKITFPFIQDPGTADAMAQWRLRELQVQRWQVDLVAWQNILAAQLGDTLSLDSHPNLSPALVFRVLGKSYRIGDEQPSRIGLTAVEVPPLPGIPTTPVLPPPAGPPTGAINVLIFDDFTRANNADLGAAWDVLLTHGAFKILSNTAQPNALSAGDCGETNNSVALPNNQYAKVRLSVTGTTAGTGPGCILRASAVANTCYRVDVNKNAANNVRVAKNVAGIFTSLATFTTAWVDDDELTFAVYGSGGGDPVTLAVYRNGVLLGSTTDPAASILSGRAGVFYAQVATAASISRFAAGQWVPA